MRRRGQPHGERHVVDAPPDAKRQRVCGRDSRSPPRGGAAPRSPRAPLPAAGSSSGTGSRAATIEIGTTRSASSAMPCSARKTPVRIARKRCTSSTAKRGQVNFARADIEHAEHDRGRQEQVGDDPRGAGDVPGERGHAAASSRTLLVQVSVGRAPPRRGRRTGRRSPRSSSHAGPASSSSSAAFAATSAARHVGAATVTSRQQRPRTALRSPDRSGDAGARPPRSQRALRDAARRKPADGRA